VIECGRYSTRAEILVRIVKCWLKIMKMGDNEIPNFFIISKFGINELYELSTESRGRLFSTPASYSGGPGFKSRPGDRLSRLRFFVRNSTLN
jgi:hypothetical protein